MKEERGMKNRFTSIELLVVIVVALIFISLVVPGYHGSARGKAMHARCKSNLKQIGTTVAVYFYDGDLLHIPVEKYSLVDAGEEYEMDPNTIKCPITETRYIWFSDGEYKGAANIPLAGDSVAHIKKPAGYTVYQDGHVE